MSSSTCQQFVDDAVKISNIFLDFQLSQGSVATYCRCGGNLCGTYVQNFPTNQLVKEFRKSVHICQSYYQTSKGYTFLRQCMKHNETFCETGMQTVRCSTGLLQAALIKLLLANLWYAQTNSASYPQWHGR